MWRLSEDKLRHYAEALNVALSPIGVAGGHKLTARGAARVLQLSGYSVEQQRRIVREVVRYGRGEMGLKICASIQDGYWKARTPQEWKDYEAATREGLVFRFAEMGRRRDRMVDMANRQGTLFDTRGSNAWAH